MRHAREDYNRIQDPAGLIPDDEPVFLLRGQDSCAAVVVWIYGWIVRLTGGDREIARRSVEQSKAMRVWRVHKRPDMPRVLSTAPETRE